MKLLRFRLQDAARRHGLMQEVVERDYAQSHVLVGLSRSGPLREILHFKGGTALKKVHFGEYRFSEDLDFSGDRALAPPEFDMEAEVRNAVLRAHESIQMYGDVHLSVHRYRLKEPHPGGQDAFEIPVQFPWQTQPFFKIKLEITWDEPVLLPAPTLPILHDPVYEERLDAALKVYSLDEICAEKLRAGPQTLKKFAGRVAERGEDRAWMKSRARDFYDLWRLTALGPEQVDWNQVAAVLASKCEVRQVRISSLDDVFDERLLREVRKSWHQQLGKFLRALPDVEQVLGETRERLIRKLALK